MATNNRPRGLSCPECSTLIVIDISNLVMTGRITCPNCQLELLMDKDKSAESIAVLMKFKSEFNSAEQHYEEAQYSETHKSERRSSHSRRATVRSRRRTR